MSAPDLDWTFGPAPTPGDDPPPNAAPRRPRPNPAAALRLSRRTWLLLGAVAGLAVALSVALPLIETARARQAVERVVAAQEADRLAGEWDALSATYAPDTLAWAVTHVLRLRHGWLPTPISLPGLRSDGLPGRVIRFQVIGPQLVRADVERGFVLASGTPVTFAMPQFYQFAQVAGRPAGWRQAPPPDPSKDPAEHIHGPRVDLTYYPPDADLAAAVAADLGDVLARACADWNCPPELHVAVAFDPSDPASAASAAAFDTLLGSLTFQVILGRPSTYPATAVNLATRLTGGYPTNPAASEAVRRVAGVQALLLVAQQFAPHTLLHGENAYLDAMIAREASRLGLDGPGLRQMQIANPLFQPAELWSVPRLHFTSDGALPEALVILNRVLADRDLTDEQRLMHGLDDAGDVETWLAAGRGLGLTPAQVLARLSRALDARFPPVQWPSFTPELALSCPSGPVLATLAGQTAPLIAGDFPDSPVEAWSPDGQRLALAVSGRRGIVAMGNPVGQFLPRPSFQTGLPVSSASNTLLVYPPENVYLPSPDGAWAAVVRQPSANVSALSIIPALGGPPIFTAPGGYNPAWSVDSRRLAFAQRAADGTPQLAVLDLAQSGTRHPVIANFGEPPRAGTANADPPSLMPAWSPAGDRLAVAWIAGARDGLAGWVGIERPDGADFKRLPAVRDNLAPYALAYSADGRYLAAGLFDGAGSWGVAVYADGALRRWLPGFQAGPWSPGGHTLALVGLGGVSLLREPDATPQIMGPAGCTSAAWKP